MFHSFSNTDSLSCSLCRKAAAKHVDSISNILPFRLMSGTNAFMSGQAVSVKVTGFNVPEKPDHSQLFGAINSAFRVNVTS